MSCTVTNSWTRNKDFTIRQINARENRRSKTSGWAKTIIRLIKMKMQIEYERQRRILQRERRWDLNLERWVDLEWGVGDLGRIGIALPRPSESELSSIGSRSVMLVWTWRANGQLQLPKEGYWGPSRTDSPASRKARPSPFYQACFWAQYIWGLFSNELSIKYYSSFFRVTKFLYMFQDVI